ncbi:MAG: hypothetical protein DMG37_18335 [Acidobacteria bacterium]|nr:MAG: hypothetical protein DMG37_18335 [Acidobacteriota bacterium]
MTSPSALCDSFSLNYRQRQEENGSVRQELGRKERGRPAITGDEKQRTGLKTRHYGNEKQRTGLKTRHYRRG